MVTREVLLAVRGDGSSPGAAPRHLRWVACHGLSRPTPGGPTYTFLTIVYVVSWAVGWAARVTFKVGLHRDPSRYGVILSLTRKDPPGHHTTFPNTYVQLIRESS